MRENTFFWLEVMTSVERLRSGLLKIRWRKYMRHMALPLVATLLVFTFGSAKVVAHEVAIGNLVIGHPWSRATPNGAEVGGAYFTITNTGGEQDTLVSATSDASDRIEFHQMSMSGDVMKMGPVSDALDIAPGQTLVFEPGGLHLMLFGLKTPLTAGGKLEVELRFAKAGSTKTIFKIENLGAKSSTEEQSK